MAKTRDSKKLRITLNLGFREFLGVLLCGILFFILPIALVTYFEESRPANSETYTAAAIVDTQAKEEGKVAGIFTTNTKYIHIPLLNFDFDTTLSETSSIIFLFGFILFIGGTILGLTAVASYNKKIVIRR